ADSVPSLSIFPPSKEEIDLGGKATVLCSVENFYPPTVEVVWKRDNVPIATDVQNSQKVKGTDSTYSMFSSLSVPSGEYSKYESYECEVKHSTSSTPVIASFYTSQCSV
ncbi:hypothetical protein GDO78_011479, partial [Eleutherodactylus coqui]